MNRFAGQVALITGAGSGIGRATALALAAEGASLWLVGRRLAALEDVAAQARSLKADVRCCAVDVGLDSDVAALAARVHAESAGLDVLIHSAGTIAMGALESAAVADFDRQYQINVRAPYLLTQSSLPALRSKQGQVVFVNSTAGLTAAPHLSQYAATKFALKALADSIRAELNPDGIRVLTVYTGRTATPMQQTVCEMEGRPYRPEQLIQPGDVAALIISALALPRTAEVTEVAVRPMQKPPGAG